MVHLTRLNSQRITVNSDLIKFVESNPDTVITLLSGEKILVQESADEVLARVVEFRRAIINGLFPITSDPYISTSKSRTAERHSGSSPDLEEHSRG